MGNRKWKESRESRESRSLSLVGSDSAATLWALRFPKDKGSFDFVTDSAYKALILDQIECKGLGLL